MNLPDYVWVDSPIFGDNLGAYVQSVDLPLVQVRLDLEDTHPAMQDAIADGHDKETAEFIDHVHMQDVRDQDGNVWDASGYVRSVGERERAAQEDLRKELALERVKKNRVPLPFLDLHLQSRRNW